MHYFRTGYASFILGAIINWKTDLGKLLSWVSFCYLFWLRVLVFNKIVFSSLCVLCQCPGNIIASDDFAVKLPSLETHCYISPEHFHLAWILVPRLQIHSVFFAVYQKKGGASSFPHQENLCPEAPSFQTLSAENQEMLNVIFHIHSDPLSQLRLHCQVQQQTLSVKLTSLSGHCKQLPGIFYYSFTHFPNWFLQITAREPSRYHGALLIPSSQCRTFCLFISDQDLYSFLKRLPF